MSKKHGLIMIACCVIAMGAAVAVFFFKVPANNVFIILLFLLCPLSHVLMMGMMGRGNHEHHETSEKLPSPKNLGKGLE
ncbi:MAG: Uncharacterized protein FD147_536 [Chloroflexi bacterium]|nr:MAG: Uncharacterized protein FD147_536 [Chloroflexota bacterium]